jgi:DNA anti-recombination protein RmuC
VFIYVYINSLKSLRALNNAVKIGKKNPNYNKFGKKYNKFGKKYNKFGKKYNKFGKKYNKFGKKYNKYLNLLYFSI